MASHDLLPVALRAYAPPNDRRPSHRRADRYHRPDLMFVFDTETTIDAAQALTFGSWRVHERRANAAAESPEYDLIEEGIFYADDLANEHRAILREYVRRHWYDNNVELQLMTRREFVDRVFWRRAYRERALTVGFNLPFDLSRIAVECGEARHGLYVGGFSFAIWDYLDQASAGRLENRYRPRITIKTIDGKRHLISFTAPRETDFIDRIPDGAHGQKPDEKYTFRGHFLDAHTLAFDLTDRSHTLASAIEAFGVRQGKLKIKIHGVITPEYIDYNRQDVAATFELVCKLLEEYDRHPISPEYRGRRDAYLRRPARIPRQASARHT